MQRLGRGLGFASSGAFAVLAACVQSTSPAPAAQPSPGLLRVTAVDVAILESYPPQVHAQVTGEVPDVCTRLDAIRQRREGRIITVTITTRRTAEQCILLLPPPLEVAFPLDGPFEGGEYLLHVNGFVRKVRL
jgi:hypothetical protein